MELCTLGGEEEERRETFYCFASVIFSFPPKATNHFQPTGRGRQTRLVYGYLGAHLNVNEARGGDAPSGCLLLAGAMMELLQQPANEVE